MSDVLLGLIFLAAIFIYGISKASPSTSKKSRRRKLDPSSPPAFHWEDGGNFNFEVVGESFYQDNIKKLAGDHGDHGSEAKHLALLIPDDGNPYDDKAVAVFINRLQVGHLSRNDARSFRRRLGRKKLTGENTSCDAVIQGGGLKDGERFKYGVWLDMKPFD